MMPDVKTILLFLLFVASSASGQTGDFQLKNSEQRPNIIDTANPKMGSTGFARFLIGKNYRQEWTTPIHIPVLDFKNDFGGLTPEKEGGGKQTHSLHLKSGDGRNWVLRSIKKFPEKVIAPELQGTIFDKLIRDGVSGSYPYSGLSIGTLAHAAGVPFFPNTIVYIPDDPALGEFRSKYKNTLSLLELKTIGDKDAKMYDTEEIIPEIQQSNKKTIDQKAVLRARLLDNFIMDFDRHEGQWEWMEREAHGKTFYYPVPKDRDQAYFNMEGPLPRLVSHKAPLGPIQGLRVRPKNILTFNYSERFFDPSFLNALDEQTWKEEVDHFISAMTNDVIDRSLKKQPEEIPKYHSEKIASTLKNKKSFFKEDMLRYYRFISKTVTVIGSNDDEVFTITNCTNCTNGRVRVQVQDRKGFVTYSREFDPSVTKEIRIYGLEGNDQFFITGKTNPIVIRLVGGPGDDVFTNNAKGGKVFVYDVSFENNAITGRGFRKKISSDPLNNEYRRLSNEYKTSSIGIYAEYFREDGLALGPSYKIITHGFRKEPYASKHFFYATKWFRSDGWHLHYDADFMQVARNTDLLFRSDAKLPTVRTRFFGFGNNSVFDKSKGLNYYRVQYTLIEGSLMASTAITSWLRLNYGPALQYFKIPIERNQDKYLESLYTPEDDNGTYDGKWYAGGELRAIVNTRNNDLLPTRGILSNIYTRQLVGTNKNSNTFNQVGADLTIYTDALFKNHIILVTSFGANHNFGSFEIPQAQYLGRRQGLRGFRDYRFAGRSNAYNNTELRINFGDVNFYLVKGPFGVLAFHDVGRVWMPGEDSDTWHRGYGGGIWLAPFNKIVVTALLAHSKEEKLYPSVILGFEF
jgi:surface antigen Omp85-like protein